MKIKNFALQKDSKRMNRQAMDWKEIFANHISEKGLISRTFRNSQNSTVPNRKWAKNTKTHFT